MLLHSSLLLELSPALLYRLMRLLLGFLLLLLALSLLSFHSALLQLSL